MLLSIRNLKSGTELHRIALQSSDSGQQEETNRPTVAMPMAEVKLAGGDLPHPKNRVPSQPR